MTSGSRISVSPGICHGQIVRMMSNGDSADELLSEYPSLTRDDVMACSNYVSPLLSCNVADIRFQHASASEFEFL